MDDKLPPDKKWVWIGEKELGTAPAIPFLILKTGIPISNHTLTLPLLSSSSSMLSNFGENK